MARFKEGGNFLVKIEDTEVYKYAKFPGGLERAKKIHEDLKDIPEVLPVRVKGNALVQQRAPGTEMSEGDLITKLKKEYDEWFKGFKERVRAKGYRMGDLNGTNVFWDGENFWVVDVEQFYELAK